MAAIGAVLPALAKGAQIASALGVSAEVLDKVNQGIETVNQVSEVSENLTTIAGNVGEVSEGLSHLLENNDLNQFPNIQRAMELPEGRAQLEEAYRNIDRNTPHREREMLQDAVGGAPAPKIESYNYHPGPSEHELDSGSNQY